MASFYAFLLFHPFCPTNLPATFQPSCQIDLPAFLACWPSSLLATSACYVFYASNETGRLASQGGWKVARTRKLEGSRQGGWKAS
ncbi:hypothetical protein SESBI_42650 [Sesbania bispinosa]|nr:hypothetical protein SESBI_42650 [Sesbania bispinosa]